MGCASFGLLICLSRSKDRPVAPGALSASSHTPLCLLPRHRGSGAPLHASAETAEAARPADCLQSQHDDIIQLHVLWGEETALALSSACGKCWKARAIAAAFADGLQWREWEPLWKTSTFCHKRSSTSLLKALFLDYTSFPPISQLSSQS